MSFVQNFPFFSIILSLVCAVVSFAANARWARRLSIFLLSASVVLQGSLLVYCTVHHVRYSYMMGHYPAPWGNELTAGILEPFLAMLFAGVMLLCVLGGMGRILRDVPADRQKLYWVMVDLAHVALMALQKRLLLMTVSLLCPAELQHRSRSACGRLSAEERAASGEAAGYGFVKG